MSIVIWVLDFVLVVDGIRSNVGKEIRSRSQIETDLVIFMSKTRVYCVTLGINHKVSCAK